MICDLEDCEGEIINALVTCTRGHRYMKRPSGEIIQLASESAVERHTTLDAVSENKGKATLAIPAQRPKMTPRYMPFGKHKGEQIEDLPTDYLVWMVENLTDKPELADEAENQLKMRSGRGVAR